MDYDKDGLYCCDWNSSSCIIIVINRGIFLGAMYVWTSVYECYGVFALRQLTVEQ